MVRSKDRCACMQVMLSLAVPGCGGASPTSDGGPARDAGARDAASTDDAGSSDSGSDFDAATDAGIDAAPPLEDPRDCIREDDDAPLSACWTIEELGLETEVGNPAASSLVLDDADVAHIASEQFWIEDGRIELWYLTNAAGAWTSQVLREENTRVFDAGSRLGIGPAGDLHVVHLGFTDYDLYYATDGAGWGFERIVVGTFIEVRLMLDRDAAVHAAAREGAGGPLTQLKYVTNSSGEWSTAIIDGPGVTGEEPSICLDPYGAAHVMWYDQCPVAWPCFDKFGNIEYATNASGEWVVETVLERDAAAWSFVAVACDEAGAVHAGYVNQYRLKYGTNASGEWEFEDVDRHCDTGREELAIALDDAGVVHLLYGLAGGDEFGATVYATNRGGAWSRERVENGTGRERSIVLDSTGRPHVAYDGSDIDGHARLRYAVRDVCED